MVSFTRWHVRRAVLLAAMAIALGGRADALDVIGFTSAANDRFSSGYPTTPVTNTSGSFVGGAYSWLGVGWSAVDATKSFGFLTPKHYLVAQHYGGATTINLLSGSGTVYSSTQASVTNIGYGFTNGGTQATDIALGELTASIAASRGMPRYAVLDLNATSTTNSSYSGQPMLVYGRGPNAATSTRIGNASVQATASSGTNIYITSTTSSVILQTGDSGSPDFIPWTNPNGTTELTIIGNNAATNFSTVNVYNYIATAGALGAINALTTPDGYALRIVGNPSATWQGGSPDPGTADDLSRGSNWSGGSIPTDLYTLFSATSTSVKAIDVNANTNLRGLAFKSTGSGTQGFTFSGATTLTIGRGGVTNYDSSRQTFSAAITLGSHQYWNVGSGGVTATTISTGTGFLLELAGSGTARITGAVSGSGGVSLTGTRLEMSGASTYTGATWVHTGRLVVDGTIASSSGVNLTADGTLAGWGVAAAIAGSGAVDPGHSSGILTASSVTPSAGLDFNLEFTQLGSPTWATGTASGNDVLRLTSASTPITSAFSASNAVNVFLDLPSLSAGNVLRGGFFTDLDTSFLSLIQNGSWNYYLADAGGSTFYNGVAYSAYGGPLTFSLATVAETASFASGSEAGYVTQITVVPEPAVVASVLAGFAAFALVRRRR